MNDKNFTLLSLFVDSNQLLVPKLSTIETRLDSIDIQLFETFAKNCGNCLKSIAIRANYSLNDNEINVLLQNLVHFKSLIQLQFELWVPFILMISQIQIYFSIISNQWLLIANN
jgi:hypothetical protein